MDQTIWEANLQGAVVELPAGKMRAAVGATYRNNDYKFQNDTLVTQGTSFIEQSLGLYSAGNSEGSIQAKEVYGELVVPVLSDLPFIKGLNLELGARRSVYDTTGTSYTYKSLIDWRSNDWIRVRAGYNRAERAPNIAELYLAPENTFAMGGFDYGDVCSMRNDAAWSANPSRNSANWAKVVQLCGQLQEKVAATGDNDFYGADYRNIATWAAAHPGATQADVHGPDANSDGVADNGAPIIDTEFNQMPAGGIGFYWPVTRGNPKLEPEIADTWTLGVVLDSPFEDNRWLSDARLTLDYYIIKVKDAIGEQSADIVMRQCMDPAFNPTLDPNSPYCAGIERGAQGGLQVIDKTFYNNGRFENSGIDLSINWGTNAGPGHVNVNMLLNYLLKMETAELDVLPEVDYVGTAGPNQNGLNGNSFKWRLLTTVTYAINDINVSLRWRHTDKLDPAAAATGPVTLTGLPSYDMFDLLGNYNLTDKIGLRFGIENMFNKRPPLINVNPTAADGMYGGGFDYANTDVNGRRFYLGMRWEL